MATVGEKLNEVLLRAALDHEQQLDEQMKELDNLKEDDLEEIRRKRLEQMKSQAKKKQEYSQMGHGTYDEIVGGPEFFETCKKSKRVVCHFYRPSTERCKIMDKHLMILAHRHFETRFVKLNIEKDMRLAEKLQIYMLPTVSFIVNGKIEHNMIGFDEVGGEDEFETEELEKNMGIVNVIHSDEKPTCDI